MGQVSQEHGVGQREAYPPDTEQRDGDPENASRRRHERQQEARGQRCDGDQQHLVACAVMRRHHQREERHEADELGRVGARCHAVELVEADPAEDQQRPSEQQPAALDHDGSGRERRNRHDHPGAQL